MSTGRSVVTEDRLAEVLYRIADFRLERPETGHMARHQAAYLARVVVMSLRRGNCVGDR